VLVEVVAASVVVVASDFEENLVAFSSFDPQPLRATADMKMPRVVKAMID
jgi:hypothetical protein